MSGAGVLMRLAPPPARVPPNPSPAVIIPEPSAREAAMAVSPPLDGRAASADEVWAPTIVERLRDWLADRIATPGFQQWAARFPLTAPLARRRSRALFDVFAGFVYTQTVQAAVRLGLFELLAAEGPMQTAAIAARIGLPVEGAERLLKAAASLQLIERRRPTWWALGQRAAPLVNNVGLRALVHHHAMVYRDLADPVALLRKTGSDHPPTEVRSFFPYGDVDRPQAFDGETVTPYSQLMSDTLPPLAADILDAYDLSRHERLLDVGGGNGTFLSLALERHPRLGGLLFDLPAVTELADANLRARGLRERVALHGGNFHADPIPTGADVISLVRVCLDHDDASVLRLLTRIHRALPKGGTLLIAEAMAGAKGAEPVGDAYFQFYLLAMGRGRARQPAELREMLRKAGFRRSRVHRTPYPVQTGLISAEA